ncbi:MAG: glycoside hydrolase family 3 C-terminal domain-containing protein [Bifidobacteriaceae bacterium]|nr:glycoside hydrolase family 3 C-terminal domain-containing protein [Bifidobacteriaceae bacterium]
MTGGPRLAADKGEAASVSRAAGLSRLQKAALVTGKNNWETHDFPGPGIRSLWFADGPHGLRKQAGDADHLGLNPSLPATCFPTAAATANSWDPDLLEGIGHALGREARAQDVDVILGPGLNLKRSPLGGRNFEYFSEDPLLSGRLAAALIRGIQAEGVAGCPKHFAANSQELRRMASDSVVDERTLRELYLTGFEIAVREGRPQVVMSAYNRVNGAYASESRFLLGDVLRREWGFDGVVVTDWGGSNDIVAAVGGGSSLEMPAAGYASVRELVAAIAAGRLDEADLDLRAAEVANLAAGAAKPGSGAPVDSAAHHALARLAAARSCVLLKNEGSLLPLAPGTRVALIGDFADKPRFQGAGSSAVNPTQVDTLTELIAGSGLELASHARGFRRDGKPDGALAAEAVAAAHDADVVIACLGLDESEESEGIDRETLELAAVQTDLVAALAEANPRLIAAISAGGVVELDWLGCAQAAIHGYLGGQASAGGLIDVLTGAVNPSGRLAETIPLHLQDTPTAGHFPSRGAVAEYREGLFVGYRYYETAGVPVAFPFGFGLSYTTFAHTGLVATFEGAAVQVTNTGAAAGADVVQVYIQRVTSGIHRPTRELKAFSRVELAPGETRTVHLPLGEQAFRFWDVRTGAWQVEAGDYAVIVAAHAGDAGLSAVVHVEGTIPAGEPDPALPHYNTGAIREVTETEFSHLLGRPASPAAPRADLTAGDPLSRLAEAKQPLARLAGRVALAQAKRTREGKPDLDAIFRANMPFRAIAKMTGGLADEKVVNGLLHLVNGHFWSGFARIAKAFRANRRANRTTAAELSAEAQR